MKKPDFLTRDLRDEDYIGVVANNKDPLYSGRCQIRVFLLMDSIDAKELPWATPINSTFFGGNGAGSLSVPKIGQIVRVQFNNGDIYAPEYSTIQNIDTELIEAIKNDYDGTHVLAFDPDEDLNIIYQRNLGIQIYYRESFFQISPDSMITIQHASQDSMIQLEGDKCSITAKNEINISAGAKVEITADEVIVNGQRTTKVGPGPYYHGNLSEVLFPLLQTIATALDAKMPSTPGVTSGLVQQAKQAATSANVLIST
ncbi:MAG: phage baseplate assembly protein V [Novosphingobium sp.]|nr:phage baseplate assembly protein V [Novosphingobium sp.]